MNNFNKTVKLNFPCGEGLCLILECGHSIFWIPSSSSDSLKSTYYCKRCEKGEAEGTDWKFQTSKSFTLKKEIEAFEEQLSRLLANGRTIDGILANFVMYYKDIQINEHKMLQFEGLQNSFLALIFDIIHSGQMFNENFEHAMREHNQKMRLHKITYEQGLDKPGTISWKLTDLAKQTSLNNPLNLPFMHRIGNSGKTLLFWLRSLQDCCAKIILVIEQSGFGEYTSMKNAVNKPKSPLHKFVVQIDGYINWFKENRDLRNEMKSGIWFSSLSIQGNDVILTHNSKKENCKYSISVQYFSLCLDFSNKLLEKIIPEINKKLLEIKKNT